MRGARAKAIRRSYWRDRGGCGWGHRIEVQPSVRQVDADGKVRRFLRDLADAIKLPKSYRVTGQIIDTGALDYRRAKKAWTRRGR